MWRRNILAIGNRCGRLLASPRDSTTLGDHATLRVAASLSFGGRLPIGPATILLVIGAAATILPIVTAVSILPGLAILLRIGACIENAEIVLRVLKVGFGRDPVTRRYGIARHGEIPLIDLVGITPYPAFGTTAIEVVRP